MLTIVKFVEIASLSAQEVPQKFVNACEIAAVQEMA
jgi:hypothetical protein